MVDELHAELAPSPRDRDGLGRNIIKALVVIVKLLRSLQRLDTDDEKTICIIAGTLKNLLNIANTRIRSFWLKVPVVYPILKVQN